MHSGMTMLRGDGSYILVFFPPTTNVDTVFSYSLTTYRTLFCGAENQWQINDLFGHTHKKIVFVLVAHEDVKMKSSLYFMQYLSPHIVKLEKLTSQIIILF